MNAFFELLDTNDLAFGGRLSFDFNFSYLDRSAEMRLDISPRRAGKTTRLFRQLLETPIGKVSIYVTFGRDDARRAALEFYKFASDIFGEDRMTVMGEGVVTVVTLRTENSENHKQPYYTRFEFDYGENMVNRHGSRNFSEKYVDNADLILDRLLHGNIKTLTLTEDPDDTYF